MRIQETDKVLKEARFSRHNAQVHEGGDAMARAWSSISSAPGIIAAVVAITATVAAIFAIRRYR